VSVRALLPVVAVGLSLALAWPAAAAIDCQTTVDSAELLVCARIDLEAAEKSVAALERKTLAILRPNGRGVFTDAQTTWKAWRDADCAWNAYDLDSGTSDALILATCRADMTMTRADDLQSALETIH